MPLYTPLSGSWLNMTESVQRIISHRALDGAAPASPEDIMRYVEETARGWNADPTPFVWAGTPSSSPPTCLPAPTSARRLRSLQHTPHPPSSRRSHLHRTPCQVTL